MFLSQVTIMLEIKKYVIGVFFLNVGQSWATGDK